MAPDGNSLDGMVALLRRGIPEKGICSAPAEEGCKKCTPVWLHPVYSVDPNDPLFSDKDVVKTYRSFDGKSYDRTTRAKSCIETLNRARAGNF